MRRPVDSPYTITTEFGVPDSYAKFGRHSGVDYSKGTGSNVYAPTSGTLTQVVSPTGGNMVIIFDGRFYHRLMHNSQFIKPNGKVTEGELVAKSGTTGLSTGPHVHWDINSEGTYPTTFNSFINPADWLAGKYQVTSTGGNNVFQNDQEIIEAYAVAGRTPTAAEIAGWRGGSKQRFIQLIKLETDAQRTALANAQKQVSSLNTQVSTLNTKATSLETQVKSLTAQIATLTGQVKTLTDTVTAKDKEIADLKSQVATGGSNEDTQLLNSIGELLRKLIARFGTK